MNSRKRIIRRGAFAAGQGFAIVGLGRAGPAHGRRAGIGRRQFGGSRVRAGPWAARAGRGRAAQGCRRVGPGHAWQTERARARLRLARRQAEALEVLALRRRELAAGLVALAVPARRDARASLILSGLAQAAALASARLDEFGGEVAALARQQRAAAAARTHWSARQAAAAAAGRAAGVRWRLALRARIAGLAREGAAGPGPPGGASVADAVTLAASAGAAAAGRTEGSQARHRHRSAARSPPPAPCRGGAASAATAAPPGPAAAGSRAPLADIGAAGGGRTERSRHHHRRRPGGQFAGGRHGDVRRDVSRPRAAIDHRSRQGISCRNVRNGSA